MKTAVSLPDEIYTAADELATSQGWSRSRLYAEALSEYLSRYGEDTIVKRLNELSDEFDTSLDEDLSRSAHDLLERNEW